MHDRPTTPSRSRSRRPAALVVAFTLGSAACSGDTLPLVAAGGTATATGGTAPGASTAGSAGLGGLPMGGSSTDSVAKGGVEGGSGGVAGAEPAAGAPAQAGSAGSGNTAGMATDVSSDGDGNVEVGPKYIKDPNLTDLGNPKGKRFTFSMRLADSAIFRGTDATLTTAANTSRSINVYVPAKYQDGTAAPLLVLADGPSDIDLVSRALDNLTIAQDPLKKIPPFIAIAVQNGGSDSVGSERGLEYDTVSVRYAGFIDKEVLPAVVANSEIRAAYPNIKLTSDPDGKATYGCSSGGAAAFTMGWFAPDSWRRIITYSGTFVAQQNTKQTADALLYPFGAWEYHSDHELIKTTDKKPLRVFINANETDGGYNAPESGHHNWLTANQRMAAALAAKGYHYRYVFGKGIGHCNGDVRNQTLGETLSWIWRGYKTN